MVIVKNYHIRENERGTYVSLELIGEIELVQSQGTGRFYATARRTFISSTFDEAIAKLMVGKQLPGQIARVECAPHEYTLEGTGEVIVVAHRYEYTPEPSLTKEVIQEPEPAKEAVSVPQPRTRTRRSAL